MRKKTGLDWVILVQYDLEDANRHSLVNIPEILYNKLVRIVPEDKHTELGKALYDAFQNAM
jgi:hypothetical protein